jgi:hypothetical protein
MFLGVLSTLPFISAANCICCMWVLLGGGIGSFLLAKQRPAGITYGDGAFVGVLSGLFGSIIGTAIHIPMQMISLRLFGSQPEQLENLLRQFGVQEGPMRDWMMRIFSGEISAATILFTFFFVSADVVAVRDDWRDTDGSHPQQKSTATKKHIKLKAFILYLWAFCAFLWPFFLIEVLVTAASAAHRRGRFVLFREFANQGFGRQLQAGDG